MRIARGKKGRRHGRLRGRDSGKGRLVKSTRSAPIRQSFFRRGEPRRGSGQATPENEIEALRARARAIEGRLRSLNMRIRQIEEGSTAPRFIATVDSARCAGCGTCQEVCPTGAIVVKKIAQVEPKRCKGCGLCVQECPRSALLLRPVGAD